MKRIGCLTFHASHNFGSALQTYALKNAVESLSKDLKYNVIDFRQKEQELLYTSPFYKNDFKSLYCRFFLVGQKKALDVKFDKFESFISSEFNLIKNPVNDNGADIWNKFDTLICGSDQIWNTRALDFSWHYYLDFNTRARKIAYSPSMGTKEIQLTDDEKKRIKSSLANFAYISVRDLNTKQSIEKLTNKNVDITIDPTLLLSKNEWFELIERYKLNIPSFKYILFYDLSHNKANWITAKKISKKLNIPLLILSVPYPRVINMSCFLKKDYSSGPVDFLNYIKHASLVITSSFHGTVFSLLFNVPFLSLNTQEDMRINHLLNETHTKNRIIDNNASITFDESPFIMDFDESNKILQIRREECKKILKNNI